MLKYIDEKYEEIKKKVVLKGFRPGKVPKEILKKISELGISQSIVSAQEHSLLQESVAHYQITNFFESIKRFYHWSSRYY